MKIRRGKIKINKEKKGENLEGLEVTNFCDFATAPKESFPDQESAYLFKQLLNLLLRHFKWQIRHVNYAHGL